MKLRQLLDQIEAIQKRLKVSPVKIVGGTPRDKVLNRLAEINDLDLTTGDKSIDYIAKEISVLLGRYYSFDFKTMTDGHSSIKLGNLKIDFSSNFQVPNIEAILNKIGIHNPTEMQKETFSRDFTCNALLMDLDLKTITDPTHLGLKDIKDKMLKTCLAPEITLTANKNRVVRSIYLAAKLDFNVDPLIIEWIKKNPAYFWMASDHAIYEKLHQAMDKDSDKTLYLLKAMGLNKIAKTLSKYRPQETK
jgi:poly(A) polymerase